MKQKKFRQWMPESKSFHYWGIGIEGVSFVGPASGKMSPENYTHEESTGLLDKNGKEIFEGDILSDPSWWWGPGFVYLLQGECGPCRSDSVMQYVRAHNISEPTKNAVHNLWEGHEVEVIGNIHENPELLGVKA